MRSVWIFDKLSIICVVYKAAHGYSSRPTPAGHKSGRIRLRKMSVLLFMRNMLRYIDINHMQVVLCVSEDMTDPNGLLFGPPACIPRDAGSARTQMFKLTQRLRFVFWFWRYTNWIIELRLRSTNVVINWFRTIDVERGLKFLKRKKVYIAPYSKHVTRGLWKCSGMDNSVTCKHTIPVFYFRKRSPDGATTDYSDRNLVTAYHSFIDPERIKGWINWPSWLIYSGWKPT